jgi:ketosteroid isomerase-like protein
LKCELGRETDWKGNPVPTSRRSLIAASLTVPTFTQAATREPVDRLVRLSAEANAALLRGEGGRYFDLVMCAEDFTLMSPFGGKPSHGTYSRARMEEIGRFFRNGTLQQELVQTYDAPGMVVLVTIERAHVEVGGLPVQDWALRVTQVYRRDGKAWRLAHRHADPLAPGISLEQAATLARGGQ